MLFSFTFSVGVGRRVISLNWHPGSYPSSNISHRGCHLAPTPQPSCSASRLLVVLSPGAQIKVSTDPVSVSSAHLLFCCLLKSFPFSSRTQASPLFFCSLPPNLDDGSFFLTEVELGLPGGLVGRESACNLGDLGSIPGLGRSSGEGNGYPLQYSGLENTVPGVTKN